MSWPSDRKDFRKRVESAGLVMEIARSGHTKVRRADGTGPTVTMSTTPSDAQRALLRACLDIRKILGVDLRR